MAGSGAGGGDNSARSVIVVGAGIGGLCCAFELMERGHRVTVLEAAGRTGGHVKTIRDPLPDGLYADVGAEHFTRPGYELYWKYVEKFDLPAVFYPRRQEMLRQINGRWYSEEQLQDSNELRGLGLNEREVAYVREHGWTELPLLYLAPYLDTIRDEYQPLGVGLDDLDFVTCGELLSRDGASEAGMALTGMRRGDGTPSARNSEVSALFRIWQQSILKHRGLPNFKREVYRLRGGNQLMTDTFAARLGDRVRLGCPVTAIEHDDAGVTVRFREFGQEQSLRADYLVCSLPLANLKKVPITPEWPDWKRYVLENVVYGSQSRVLLQGRSRFWEGDLPSINLVPDEPAMYFVYQTADEIPGDRCVLMGSGSPDVTPSEVLTAFERFYPGSSHTVEQAYVHNWSHDSWASGCERNPYPLGTLKRFWPHIKEPVGRIHFAGSFADNLPWGMDAATRSANRTAETIDGLV
jgi:monoamine oxidase